MGGRSGTMTIRIAAITCFAPAPVFRRQGFQSKILEALKVYGIEQGWKLIEGYPFDAGAVELTS